MGSRSRIRWRKVFKLGVGAVGCLALFLGLPSLIRRPEPPPLEPDIGLVPVAASREPGPERRATKGRDRGRQRVRDRRRRGSEERQGTRSEGQRRLVAAGSPTSRKGGPASTGSPVAGAPAPAPAPVPAADTASPPAPPAPPATAPPPARAAAAPPVAQTEFGFER